MVRLLPASLLAALALLVPASAHAIVGGQPASQAYPHMAAMYYDPPSDNPDRGFRFRCGASLVRGDWILTAAHCVRANLDSDSEEETIPPERIRYLVGTAKRSQGGETLQAAEVLVHESYQRPNFFSHDISLVRLASSSTLGTPIRISTPAERIPFWEPGATSRVIGWGTDAPQVGAVQDDLREVDIPIIDDLDCEVSYPSDFLIGDFENLTMICAGELHGTKDSCQGDSGGPLMVHDATGALMQVGIVSWGAFCALPTQYGVYSRAADTTLRNWIENKLAAAAPPPPPAADPLPAPDPATPPALPAQAANAQAPPDDITAIVTRFVLPKRRLRIGCRLVGKPLRGCQVEVLIKTRRGLRKLRTLTLGANVKAIVRTGRPRRIVLNGILLSTDGSRYRVRRTLRRTT